MIVIEKSNQKGKRYQVVTSTGEKLRFTQETVFKYSIFTGTEFTEEEWLNILQDTLEEECFHKILSYQSVRAHSTREVRNKLIKKNFPKLIIDRALDRVQSLGLLDDAVFAKLFVEEKLSYGNGRNKVKSELFKRGVDKEIIKEAFEHFENHSDFETQEEILFTHAKRKWQQLEREKDPYKRKQKLLAFLANRGFSAEESYRALDHCSNDYCDEDYW